MGPEALAWEMGVRVVHEKLPNGWLGAYHLGTRTITMARGLNCDPTRYRCVLSHELGHAHFGHTAADWPAGEVAADKFAATLLIPRLDDYLDAMACYGDDINAAAAALGVLPWVVYAYRRTINGNLFARIGHGQMPPRAITGVFNKCPCLGRCGQSRFNKIGNGVLL